MENSINYNGELHETLRKLIDLKSKRDGKAFTTYQLAKAINMPHSILNKLTHQDPTKRVNNPRIDTLAKIVGFFKLDGFPVTIDDLLFGHKEIDIQSQSIDQTYVEKSIQVFSLNYEQTKIGTVDIKLQKSGNNYMAFLSEDELSPFFKKGSIFIVDKDEKPEHDNIVAIKMEKYKRILIKKLVIEENKQYLMSLDNSGERIPLLPTSHYLILGVITQVNAKT